jgi:hypothetical protein
METALSHGFCFCKALKFLVVRGAIIVNVHCNKACAIKKQIRGTQTAALSIALHCWIRSWRTGIHTKSTSYLTYVLVLVSQTCRTWMGIAFWLEVHIRYMGLTSLSMLNLNIYVPRGSIPGKGKIFPLLYNFQTVSGAHPASYRMGTWGKEAVAWSWPLTTI